MYTIRQAAARSGLTVPTVRAWERRYGVIHPERTATGYRLYDDGAIDRLIAMRHLVEGHGMRPSQAAERLSSPDVDVAGLVADAAVRAGRPTPDGVADAGGDTEAVHRFVEAALRLDVSAMERVLDDRFAAERFEAAVERVVFPALTAIGESWEAGRMDPGMEHAASETIRRRLARFFDAARLGDGSPPVLVGLPPGAHHEIGALAFAVAALRRGLDVVYLGADVPIASWRSAVEATGAPIVVVGVVTPSDAAAAAGVVAGLRGLARRPLIALGGVRASDVPSDGVSILLPSGLDGAVETVRESVAAAA